MHIRLHLGLHLCIQRWMYLYLHLRLRLQLLVTSRRSSRTAVMQAKVTIHNNDDWWLSYENQPRTIWAEHDGGGGPLKTGLDHACDHAENDVFPRTWCLDFRTEQEVT